MNRNLLVAIEDAEIKLNTVDELEDVIISLSDKPNTTAILLDEFKANVLESEKLWQAIELRADFKANYSDREHAHADYLKEYFKR